MRVRPILLDLGPLKVHAYGLGLALAFLLGSLWISRRARPLGYRDDELMRLAWWILASALIGARLYYVLQHPEEFGDSWGEIFRVWRGGLTQYGGVIGALLVGALFIRSRGWSFREVGDLCAPALALGEGVARIGCFFNGCCFGQACSLPWAVSFPPGSHAHWVLGSTPVHPSQLYLSVANFLLFAVLARVRIPMARPGRLLAMYLVASSGIRFLVDFTRYYAPEDTFALGSLRLAHSQWMMLAFLLMAAILWWGAPVREPKADGSTSGLEPAADAESEDEEPPTSP
jgi:phosphatidylglycerol:prolipoprotein diacylglycerol transferase